MPNLAVSGKVHRYRQKLCYSVPINRTSIWGGSWLPWKYSTLQRLPPETQADAPQGLSRQARQVAPIAGLISLGQLPAHAPCLHSCGTSNSLSPGECSHVSVCLYVCMHICPVGTGHGCVWMEMGLSLGLPAWPYFSLFLSLGLLLVREALCTSSIEPLSSAEGRYCLCWDIPGPGISFLSPRQLPLTCLACTLPCLPGQSYIRLPGRVSGIKTVPLWGWSVLIQCWSRAWFSACP